MRSSNDRSSCEVFVNDIAKVMNEGHGAYFVGNFESIYPEIDQRLTVGSEKGPQPWHADMVRFYPNFVHTQNY